MSKVIFFLIIIIGLLLRAFFLLLNPNFTTDEAILFELSRLPYHQLISGNYWDFPAHPFFAHIIVKTLSNFSIDERWLRLPYMIASALSVLSVYLLAIEIFRNKKIALLGAFMITISAYSIFYSIEMKYYSILLFFELCALLFYFRIIKQSKEDNLKIVNLVCFFLFCFLALMTDYSFIWLYTMFFCFTLILNLGELKKAIPVLVGLISVLFLFSPWLAKFISSLNISLTMRDFVAVPIFEDIIETLSVYLTFVRHKYINLLYVLKGEWWENFSLIFGKFGQIIYYLFHISLLFPIIVIFASRKLRKDMSINFFRLVVLIPITLSFAISYIISPIFLSYNLMIVQIGLIFIFLKFIQVYRKLGILFLLLYTILNVSSLNFIYKYGVFFHWQEINSYLATKNLDSSSALLIFPNYYQPNLAYYQQKYDLRPGYKTFTLEVNFLNKKTNLDDFQLNKFNKLCFLYNNYDHRTSRITITDYLENYFTKDTDINFAPWGFFVECFINQSNPLLPSK